MRACFEVAALDDARGAEVPLLGKPASARITHWLLEEEGGATFYAEGGEMKAGKGAHVRTWIKSPNAQRAVLSVKSGYVTVHVNGIPVLDAATFWSSDWNIQVELRKGHNEIDVKFGEARRARGPVPVRSLPGLPGTALGAPHRRSEAQYPLVRGQDGPGSG